MSRVSEVRGRQVLDSRGNPTVEVDVVLDSGVRGRAIVPSGRLDRVARGARAPGRRRRLARQGRHARRRERQRGDRSGPRRALRDPTRPRSTRRSSQLDGTANKGRLGANAILGVSLAVARARRPRTWACRSTATWGAPTRTSSPCRSERRQRRRPRGNSIDLQEFMVVRAGRRASPRRCGGARRSTTRSRPSCTSAASRPPSATRAGSHRPPLERGRDRGDPRSRRGAPATARPSRSRSIRRPSEVYRDGAVSASRARPSSTGPSSPRSGAT